MHRGTRRTLGYGSIHQSASSQQFSSIMDAPVTQRNAGLIKKTKSLLLKPGQVKALFKSTLKYIYLYIVYLTAHYHLNS